ncbi:MAG: PEP/pyruvate-binding domain-containing protein, partial [Nitrospirota bacterium]
MYSLGRIRDRLFKKALPVKDAFGYFKKTLDSNNHALEIITGMGEKLGGDYLFDINYIKGAWSELKNAIDSSVGSFSCLTQDKYRRLRPAFERISGQIENAVDEKPAHGEPVIPYAEMTWDSLRDAGPKNFNLAEIKNRLGINVPEAFAITIHAFDAFVRHNSLEENIRAVCEDPSDETLSMLRDEILKGELPPAVSGAIEKAVRKLASGCKGACSLAIRSSAQAEDGEFSFAGQFETLLNVPASLPDVGEAYKKVVASLFSAGAAVYQKKIGIEPGRLKMAAGCLVMVDAAVSGVIYTADPGSPGRMLVNAAWGLGNIVVEGQTGIDTYLVDRDGATPGLQITGKTIGLKTVSSGAKAGGGTAVSAVPEGMAAAPCLDDGQVYELARLALSIEKHFRGPQDIEWAIDREGKIFILQSRPLKMPEARGQSREVTVDAPVIMKDKGTVVQKGTAAGEVFILRHEDELGNVPRGAVVVSAADSSKIVRIMPYISA